MCIRDRCELISTKTKRFYFLHVKNPYDFNEPISKEADLGPRCCHIIREFSSARATSVTIVFWLIDWWYYTFRGTTESILLRTFSSILLTTLRREIEWLERDSMGVLVSLRRGMIIDNLLHLFGETWWKDAVQDRGEVFMALKEWCLRIMVLIRSKPGADDFGSGLHSLWRVDYKNQQLDRLEADKNRVDEILQRVRGRGRHCSIRRYLKLAPNFGLVARSFPSGFDAWNCVWDLLTFQYYSAW